MTVLSIAYAALFYAATAILVVGVALKIRSVALRLTREVVFFELSLIHISEPTRPY